VVKLTAETVIADNLDRVWQLTHTPEAHVRWDLRFTDIEPLPSTGPGAPQRFRYARQIGGGLVIEGWGETVGQPDQRGSALRFGSGDPRSLIREGSGCWIYKEQPGGVRFSTVYDYAVRFGWAGRVLDRLLFRPLMVWTTRWSFDRLRLWIEQGISPELSLRLWGVKTAARVLLGLVWVLEGLVPKLLAVSPGELELVRRSGLFWPTPAMTLGLLGAVEVLAGLWLIAGRAERWSVGIASLVMLFLASLVASAEPAALADPLGGLSKNLGLLACALVVWALSPMTPSARRADPRRHSQ
jgi:uncharacterized membrane protein YphA (DoxX/SURF4 family)